MKKFLVLLILGLFCLNSFSQCVPPLSCTALWTITNIIDCPITVTISSDCGPFPPDPPCTGTVAPGGWCNPTRVQIVGPPFCPGCNYQVTISTPFMSVTTPLGLYGPSGIQVCCDKADPCTVNDCGSIDLEPAIYQVNLYIPDGCCPFPDGRPCCP